MSVASEQRLLKLASVLRSELANIINKEVELPANCLMTISKLEVLSDYSEVRIGLSVLPFEKSEAVLAIMVRARHDIQQIINKRLRLYRIPKLAFYIDEAPEKAAHITDILDRLS